MSTSVEEARAALRARLGATIGPRHGLNRKQVARASAVPTGPDNSEKVKAAVHKMGGQDMTGGDVVFFRKEGERVMHFNRPRISIAPNANVAFVSGAFSEKSGEEFNTDKHIMQLIKQLSAAGIANNPEAAEAKGPTVEEVPELVPDDFEREAELD